MSIIQPFAAPDKIEGAANRGADETAVNEDKKWAQGFVPTDRAPMLHAAAPS